MANELYHVPPHISPFNLEHSSVDLPLAYRKDLKHNAEFIAHNPLSATASKNLF